MGTDQKRAYRQGVRQGEEIDAVLLTKKWVEFVCFWKKVWLLTFSPQIGSPVKISVTSSFTKCFCHIMAKKVLLSSREIQFNNQRAILSFTPTLLNVPKTDIIFFNIDPMGNIISNRIIIDFTSNLPNYVKSELHRASQISYKTFRSTWSFQKALSSQERMW